MTAEIIVGRLFAKKTRDFLNRCKSQGRIIDFIEKPRWLLDKRFIINGSQMKLNVIITELKNMK